MVKTSNYWDKRAIKRLSEAEKTSDVYIGRIKKIYEQAYKDINLEIEKIYKNYSKETGLDVQKLKELLTRSETKKTWEQMKRQGLDKYIKDNYKSRISRLEQIQAQIYAKAKQIYPKEQLEQAMCYKGVINDSYYKAIYDTQMGTGYDFSFNKIDKNMTTALLNENWSGVNYSQRIWGNTDILADSLSQVLGGALLSGQSIEKTTKQIRDRFNVGKYYAERLVRTETNHFNNEADAMAYEEMGIDKYVFVATLDSRTSEICQNHDGKVYDYKDKETGVNFPPLHPNCRSKTRGYLGEEMEKQLKRRARNPVTGKTEIIDNINYNDWKKRNNLYTEKIPSSSNEVTDFIEHHKVDVKQYNSDYMYNGYRNDFLNIQEEYSKILKYDKPMQIVSKKDYDNYKGVELSRVLTSNQNQSAEDIKKANISGNIRYSGQLHSHYGKGIYFGEKSIENKLIREYGNEDFSILSAKISEDAKIIEYNDMMEYIKGVKKLSKKIKDDDLARFFYNSNENTNMLFMNKGIDIIKIKRDNYYVVLNRGVLITYDQ